MSDKEKVGSYEELLSKLRELDAIRKKSDGRLLASRSASSESLKLIPALADALESSMKREEGMRKALEKFSDKSNWEIESYDEGDSYTWVQSPDPETFAQEALKENI